MKQVPNPVRRRSRRRAVIVQIGDSFERKPQLLADSPARAAFKNPDSLGVVISLQAACQKLD